MKHQALTIARFLLLASPLLLIAPLAQAYVGPGAGLSALGSVLALIGAFLLLLVGFVWYPIKRLLRRFGKSAKDANANANAGDDSKPGDPTETAG